MGKRYADVIVDISHEQVDRPFQYEIPQRMQETLDFGMCVEIPFGNGNKIRKGYVVGLSDKCNWDPAKMKAIHRIVVDSAAAQDRQIKLAAWIKKNYGATMIQAIKTVIPARKSVKKVEHKKLILKATREEALDALGQAQRKHQVAKARLLKELLNEGELPYEWVTGKLMVSAATVSGLEKAGIVRKEIITSYRNPVKRMESEEADKKLSDEQTEIVREVTRDYDTGNRGTYLIHGITGSGKTEVYIRLIEEIVARGKQAIVLIPEIALTYQTLLRFYRHFGDRVSVLNSSLSAGEKYDQCERAKHGEIDVIIGPRSALFTPFPHLGLIIIDEEHEASYKSESAPKYHARETAIYLAEITGASVVLGSATPSLEAFYRAKQGQYRLFSMTKRLTGGALPQIYTVDLREELKSGNRTIFSRKLQELLADRLAKGQQSMLFINRRGLAGFVSCRACGYVAKCPHCDVSLSEHRGGRLLCHYCGYEMPSLKNCPECGSKYISGFRAGTQQIEDKLKELYPQMRVLRMDADTTKTKDSYEEILTAFRNGEADVLVGTQMIVKGHDFPNVTLVGVLAEDLSLSVGDYRAGERTFQLITQAAGRAGRGSLPGEVVVQTYQPEHYAIVHAGQQDYLSFYEEEIMYRKMMQYPPAAHMLAVQLFGRNEMETLQTGKLLAERVKGMSCPEESLRSRLQVIGPSPAGIGKIEDIYRFVFYVKHKEYEQLVQVKDMLEEHLHEGNYSRVSVQFDFDPVNGL
ncbi:MAG: primosomal protein N' [Lachnospiraceae bacterium]|nr:primosomal protein N' [Lachnospiraceae bacterium]